MAMMVVHFTGYARVSEPARSRRVLSVIARVNQRLINVHQVSGRISTRDDFCSARIKAFAVGEQRYSSA